MAERPEDLNLPNAVITRIIKEAVGAGPGAAGRPRAGTASPGRSPGRSPGSPAEASPCPVSLPAGAGSTLPAESRCRCRPGVPGSAVPGAGPGGTVRTAGTSRGAAECAVRRQGSSSGTEGLNPLPTAEQKRFPARVNVSISPQ